jgi:hypothetical protein
MSGIFWRHGAVERACTAFLGTPCPGDAARSSRFWCIDRAAWRRSRANRGWRWAIGRVVARLSCTLNRIAKGGVIAGDAIGRHTIEPRIARSIPYRHGATERAGAVFLGPQRPSDAARSVGAGCRWTVRSGRWWADRRVEMNR